MVTPLEYTTYWKSMNNLETLHPQSIERCETYKHSLSECSIKLNAIKDMLGKIALSTDDSDSKHMAESAQILCDELIREIT